MTRTQTQPRSPFHALHVAGDPLRLTNVWDAASARLVAAAGARAIATTSAGIAWSLGYADGNQLSRDEAISAITRIVESVSVPVSVDLEGGYSASPVETEETVSAALAVGIAGINLEDGSRTPADFAARIQAARRAADGLGAPLFINARTDVFLAGGAATAELLAETIGRAARYLDAGADGIFVPGAAGTEVIRQLVEGIPAPVNVMVGAGSPSVAELGALGVARVSLGSSVAEAAYALVARAAHEFQTAGTATACAGGLPYRELNALFPTR